MPITAQEVVKSIGKGVAAALRTNQFFLGIDEGNVQNANIRPEYVTTVEVARALCGQDRIVRLEAHMKAMRLHARGLVNARNLLTKSTLSDLDAILEKYQFGQKRIDVLVRSENSSEAPLVIAEAKLGVKNSRGIAHDIGRVLKLLAMYNDLQLLDHHRIYGAVLFHYFEEGNDKGALNRTVKNLQAKITANLQARKRDHPWLKAKVGMLKYGSKIQPAQGYQETYMDGTQEEIFQKESFTFAPGLVLLGNALDVETVAF